MQLLVQGRLRGRAQGHLENLGRSGRPYRTRSIEITDVNYNTEKILQNIYLLILKFINNFIKNQNQKQNKLNIEIWEFSWNRNLYFLFHTFTIGVTGNVPFEKALSSEGRGFSLPVTTIWQPPHDTFGGRIYISRDHSNIKNIVSFNINMQKWQYFFIIEIPECL